jgi:Immunoglobulin I-set domain
LNIEAEPEAAASGGAPTFIEKPKIESSADGKKVTMSCKVKADPKPTVVWTRESVVVKESSRISISIVQEKDVYAIKLELKDPHPDDAGIYKCTVKNAHGEVNANLTLNIESKRIIVNDVNDYHLLVTLFVSCPCYSRTSESYQSRKEANNCGRMPR